MAQQHIGLGTAVNDGTGDSLHAGGLKIEANFTELYTLLTVGGAPGNFNALMLAWFNSLPTTAPGTAGVLWNNGGTLAKS
jgi:hypothetical protein